MASCLARRAEVIPKGWGHSLMQWCLYKTKSCHQSFNDNALRIDGIPWLSSLVKRRQWLDCSHIMWLRGKKTVAQRKCIDRYKDSVFLPQTNNQHSTYNCFLMQCEQTSHWTWSCFTTFVFILDDDSVNWKVNIGIQRNAVDMWWQKKTVVLTSLTWTFLRAFRLNFSVPWSTAGRAAKEMPKLKC